MVQVPHRNEDVCTLADRVAGRVAIEPPCTVTATEQISNGQATCSFKLAALMLECWQFTEAAASTWEDIVFKGSADKNGRLWVEAERLCQGSPGEWHGCDILKAWASTSVISMAQQQEQIYL